MKNNLPKRKTIRHPDFCYSGTGIYFMTICTKNHENLLSRIVGTGVPDGPILEFYEKAKVELSEKGRVADRYINQLSDFYTNIYVDSYVIMPNHIHLLLSVKAELNLDNNGPSRTPENGPSRTPVPTVQNSVVSRFISTLKRFCNREYGENIWQPRSFDHVIRNDKDYDEHIKYIVENPARWNSDEFYNV